MALILRITTIIVFLTIHLSAIDAQRLVSLLPSATYALAQMGADAHVVGRTSYCPAPQQEMQSQIVGDAMTVNIEIILRLKPDAVIVSPFTKQAVKDKLKQMKIRTLELPTPKNFDEICAQSLQLGALAGCPEAAQSIVTNEVAKVAELLLQTQLATQLGSAAETSRTAYIQIGTHPTYGATPDYYIGSVAQALNLRNVLKINEGGCVREEIARRKPDVIIVSTMGGLGKDEAAWWRKMTQNTPGTKVMVVDENILCCPTPTFYRQTLEIISSELK